MPRISDKMMAVARVYAVGLLAVAEERGEAEGLAGELAGLAELASRSPAFGGFLASPLIESDQRAASIERALRGRLSDLLVDALGVINRKGRMELLPAIAQAYAEKLTKLRGRVRVKVTSAQPLTDDQRDRLRAAIAASDGLQAVFSETVDASVLGGLIVQIGDHKIDGSIATRIRSLSAALLARGSRQIRSGAHVEY